MIVNYARIEEEFFSSDQGPFPEIQVFYDNSPRAHLSLISSLPLTFLLKTDLLLAYKTEGQVKRQENRKDKLLGTSPRLWISNHTEFGIFQPVENSEGLYLRQWVAV